MDYRIIRDAQENTTINKYTLKQNFQSRLSGYCFDDLGTEQQIKHFGNDCNVMAEVLISRYEQFVENNSITHLTSNLSASEIEMLYGNRGCVPECEICSTASVSI